MTASRSSGFVGRYQCDHGGSRKSSKLLQSVSSALIEIEGFVAQRNIVVASGCEILPCTIPQGFGVSMLFKLITHLGTLSGVRLLVKLKELAPISKLVSSVG